MRLDVAEIKAMPCDSVALFTRLKYTSEYFIVIKVLNGRLPIFTLRLFTVYLQSKTKPRKFFHRNKCFKERKWKKRRETTATKYGPIEIASNHLNNILCVFVVYGKTRVYPFWDLHIYQCEIFAQRCFYASTYSLTQ